MARGDSASFEVHIFYPDGEAPESGEQVIEELSPKWLALFENFLDRNGPVFDQNLGSTLSHFDVRMGGPIGQWIVNNETCFDFAISRGEGSDQDNASIEHMRTLLQSVVQASGKVLSDSAEEVLTGSARKPSLLLFDSCSPGIDEQNKGAAIELTCHQTGAYLRYCEVTDEEG